MSDRGWLKREYVHAPLHSMRGMAVPQLVWVNGCPGRPGHYAETLSIHTTITLSFPNCLGKGVGQVGHDATDLTVAT